MLLFLYNVGWGQVANYTFASSSGTYTAITGGTLIISGTTALDSWASPTAITIPSFTFNGTAYTTAWVTSNGLLTLGGTIPSAYLYTGVSTGTGPCICPFNADLDRVNTTVATEIRTETIGNEVVFQWKQFKRYGVTESFDFQIRLNTVTGAVVFVYQLNSGPGSGTSFQPEVGIRSSGTDYKNLSVTNVAGAPTWAAPTSTGNINTTTCRFTSASNAKSFASGLTYTFTPPPPCTVPTSLAASASSSAQSVTTINGSFTAAASAPTGYVVVRTTTNSQPTPVSGTTYTVGANAIGYIEYVGTTAGSWTSTALSGGTTYYYWVFSYNNTACSGGPLYSASATTFNATTSACPAYSGTMSVGPTGTFSNLTTAISNLAACGYTGNIILELQSTYVSTGETFPITFSSTLGTSSSKTITIRPATGATGLSITSANATGTINLDGASYITFDGRPGGSGAKDMVIANTNAGASPAVQFINDANNNAFNYCKINSRNTSTISGTIVFGITTGSNGNDNNTIDNCDIYDGTSTPYNAIYSGGTASPKDNSNNTISNCNIYNFYASSSVSAGIYLFSGNTDWLITNNNFYQTSSRTGNANSNYGIYISNTSGNNFSVTGNNIGGGTANCGGTAWTYTLSGSTRFVPIYLSVGSTTPSSVQNNTIANISLSSSSGVTTLPGVFGGIYRAAGNVNIGEVTGNVIGTVAGPISVTTSTSGGVSMGIGSAATGIAYISNNIISSISVQGNAVGVSASFNGIWNTGNATVLTIDNNTIGSTSVANSINSSNAATGSTAAVVQGILNSGSCTAISITNNTIANLNCAYVPSSANTNTIVRGIFSSAGSNTISGNTVRNLSTAAQATGTTSSASVIGISMTSTTAPATVSQNTIYGLSNSHATAAVCVTGIHYAGPTTGASNLVARNIVYGLSIVSSSASSDMRGINFASGLATVQNNVIRLGYNASGAALTSGISITGLFDFLCTSGTGMYFNSVYIGGTGVNTVAGNTYAFRSTQTFNNRTYQNNIFYNGRSNATTGGKHYAVMVSGTGVNPTGLALNYNDYLANGTGAVFGYYNADIADFATWKTNVGQDANSINADPLFVAATAATPNLNLSTGTPCESVGLAIGAITDDYTGASRAGLTPTDMGAYAGLFAPAGIDMKPTAITSPAASGCYTSTETVTVTIQNNAGSIIDFTLNPVTVSVAGTNAAAGYNSNIVVNTGTLGIGATMNVNMPATINMTTNGTYSFDATTTVTGDINTGNDALATVSRIMSAMGGTYTVGAAGTYTSLTAAVAAYNASTCLTGAVVFSLLDASYSAGETFPITINAHVSASATNTLTIKPAAGVTASVSGSVASGALIKFNGADYVIIDGSNSGGTDKSLTITNSATTAPSAIWLASSGVGTGCTNNTIKNCNLSTGVQTTLGYGVYVGGTTITTATAGADNDNVTIQNNTITNCTVGIYANGTAAGVNDNLNIIGNSITYNSTLTGCIGIQTGYSSGSAISQNTISVTTTGGTAPVGISIETGFVSSTVTRNNIIASTTSATAGYGGRGITVGTGTTSSSLNITNNLISGINGSNFSSFGNSSSIGIAIGIIGNSSTLTTTTGGINIYNNTVNMSGSYSYAAACLTADIYIGSGATALDIRNNIFINALNNTNGSGTTSKNYAIYSVAANTAFSNIDYNDYFISGAQGVLGYIGSDRTDLAGIVAGFGGNTNSVNNDPTFTSTPVILTPTAVALDGTGVNGLVAVDYSNVARSNPPDIGALEFTPPSCNIPTALSYTGVTNNQATLNWTAASPAPGSGYDIYYSTSATAPDGATIPNGTVAAGIVTYTTPATLTAQTTYYAWVRSNCGAGLTSNWTSSVTFTTLCDAVSSLPWTENFDGMGTLGAGVLPSCWSHTAGSASFTSANAASNTYNDPKSTPNYVSIYYPTTAAYLWTPGFQLTAGTSYDFTFNWAGDGTSGWIGDCYYNTAQSVTGITSLGASFVVASTTTSSAYTTKTYTFVPATTGVFYFGIKAYSSTTSPYYLGFDDFSLTLTPTCFPPTVSAASSIASTTATINWTAATPAPANGYEYEVRASGGAGSGATGLTATGTTAAGVLTANVAGLTANTTYSVYVRSLCSGVDLSSWSTPAVTFYTGYCIPAPTSVDGTGITNVTFSSVNNTTVAEVGNYGNYSAMVGDVTQGTTVPVSIRFATGATYATKIWVDWNDDLDFVDVGEEVYSGTSLSTNPTTLAASITVPVGATLGNHRMRIGGLDNGPATPCYTGTWGSFEDYTVNVIAPTNMVYTSSTTTQGVVTSVDAGTTSQQVIGIQVVTTNNLNPINITKFAINATGTTNVADISNAKLWSTGTSATFATTTQFGSTVAAPTTANFDITGTLALSQGTNYFWLTYDVPTTATNANVIDAECTGLTVDGTDYIPTVTAPAGTRTIVNKTATITITQAATTDVVSGATGKDILRIQFNVAGPATGTLNLNSLKVTSLNTSDADIAASGVKLYNTLTSTTFATTTQLGTSQTFAAASATFSGLNYNLPTGNTYLWVAYDIAPTATLNNTVDAKIGTNDINVGGSTYPATDQSPAGLRTIKAPLTGIVTVGTAGNYPSLTNSGGVFEAINTYGISGNLTISIISDFTGELGTYGLNNITEVGAGGYTVTIQPSAAVNRTISGNYAGALIRFSGADRVTVNGDFGGSGQYLTFSNTNTGSSNNTIAYSGNANNNTIKNCKIYSKYRAITTTVADNTLIEGNDIYGDVAGNSTYSQAGIYVTSTSINTKIRKNTIHDFYYTGSGGWGCYGIYYGAEATTVTEISNNVIYSIISDGDIASGLLYNPSGIYISSGGNIQIYYNSINLTGAVLGAGYNAIASGITINSSVTLLDIKNNVISNSMTLKPASTKAATTYSIYSLSANTAFSAINYNDYYVTGASPNIGYISSNRANLAAWQTATSQDAASISADPLFTSATNLLQTTGSPLAYAGVNIAAVTTSINGVTRTNPSDIGAYQVSVCPATSIFTGTGNWSDVARWNNGVPGPCTQATISGACTMTSNGMCTNLTINPTNSLTVNVGQTLDISGQFTIKSTVAGTGSFIDNGTVNYTTPAKVERYLSASKWHLVSSPITSALSGIYVNIWLRAYLEASNTYGAYITPLNIPMPTGQGFSVWTNTANEVRTYTGTLNTGALGPFSAQLTGVAGPSTGWNLVGNPYPSAIDWNAATGWTKTNIGNTIYIWNSNNNQYAVFNGTTGTNGGSQYIAPGQGFFVQATAGGANFSINNNARLHNPVGFMKNEPANIIRVKIENNEYSDEAVVMFDADASDNYDFKIDAAKLRGGSESPQLYLKKSDTVETAICGYNEVQKVIGKYIFLEPVNFTSHTIRYSHTVQGDLVPLLVDLVSGTIIHPDVPYVFTPAAGDPINRFQFVEPSGSGIETENNPTIMVWENANKLHIGNLANAKIETIQVFDMEGRLVFVGTQTVTDLNHLSRAMYLVKVTTENETVVKKIMIK